jgi:hypothetical protein
MASFFFVDECGASVHDGVMPVTRLTISHVVGLADFSNRPRYELAAWGFYL